MLGFPYQNDHLAGIIHFQTHGMWIQMGRKESCRQHRATSPWLPQIASNSHRTPTTIGEVSFGGGLFHDKTTHYIYIIILYVYIDVIVMEYIGDIWWPEPHSLGDLTEDEVRTPGLQWLMFNQGRVVETQRLIDPSEKLTVWYSVWYSLSRLDLGRSNPMFDILGRFSWQIRGWNMDQCVDILGSLSCDTVDENAQFVVHAGKKTPELFQLRVLHHNLYFCGGYKTTNQVRGWSWNAARSFQSRLSVTTDRQFLLLS